MQVVEFLLQWGHYIDTIDPDIQRIWPTHINNMSRDRTWATRVELIACAEIYGVMISTWIAGETGLSRMDVVRPVVPSTHGIQMLHMVMSNFNHYDRLYLNSEIHQIMLSETEKYGQDLQRIYNVRSAGYETVRPASDVEMLGDHDNVMLIQGSFFSARFFRVLRI
jgi:hypothetical protein